MYMLLTYCMHFQDGNTALHIASRDHNIGVLQILIAAQARLNTQNKVRNCLNIEHHYICVIWFKVWCWITKRYMLFHINENDKSIKWFVTFNFWIKINIVYRLKCTYIFHILWSILTRFQGCIINWTDVIKLLLNIVYSKHFYCIWSTMDKGFHHRLGFTLRILKQNRESTKGYSRWKIE